MRGPGHCAVTHGVCTKRARMSEIEGELDREKGSGDVEEGGVLLAAGNYGGRISLLTCRKQNFKRLSPGSLTQTHRHTHHPPCVFAPCPHPDSSHTLGYSELHQCISGVRVCVPPEATTRIVLMTSVAFSFALISHILPWSCRCGCSDPHNKRNPASPRCHI